MNFTIFKHNPMQEFFDNHMLYNIPDTPDPDPDMILCENCQTICADEFKTKGGYICFNCLVDYPEIEIIN